MIAISRVGRWMTYTNNQTTITTTNPQIDCVFLFTTFISINMHRNSELKEKKQKKIKFKDTNDNTNGNIIEMIKTINCKLMIAAAIS